MEKKYFLMEVKMTYRFRLIYLIFHATIQTLIYLKKLFFIVKNLKNFKLLQRYMDANNTKI